MIFIAGCSKKSLKEEIVDINNNSIKLHYVDNNETILIEKAYDLKGTTREEQVDELIKVLAENPEDNNYKSISSEFMTMERYVIEEDKRLSVYFTLDYYKLDKITEVLFRAALVKTLTQIEDIESLEFYVGGLPLTFNNNDRIVGRMKGEDFITGTGLENIVITVYFSNEKGNALVESELSITSVKNMSIEEIVINGLIETSSDELQLHGMKKTIANDTELIKVNTKDGICYVDLSEEFLDKVSGIDDKVSLYSIVNSLVELPGINKVQFTIDGEVRKIYRDKIQFDGFFERNLEIVEGTK